MDEDREVLARMLDLSEALSTTSHDSRTAYEINFDKRMEDVLTLVVIQAYEEP